MVEFSKPAFSQALLDTDGHRSFVEFTSAGGNDYPAANQRTVASYRLAVTLSVPRATEVHRADLLAVDPADPTRPVELSDAKGVALATSGGTELAEAIMGFAKANPPFAPVTIGTSSHLTIAKIGRLDPNRFHKAGYHDDRYEILRRGQLVLHLEHTATLVPERNTSCYWRVANADRRYGEFAALGLPSTGPPRLTEPQDEPWGMREFTLKDPSGNLIRVGHELNRA